MKPELPFHILSYSWTPLFQFNSHACIQSSPVSLQIFLREIKSLSILLLLWTYVPCCEVASIGEAAEKTKRKAILVLRRCRNWAQPPWLETCVSWCGWDFEQFRLEFTFEACPIRTLNLKHCCFTLRNYKTEKHAFVWCCLISGGFQLLHKKDYSSFKASCSLAKYYTNSWGKK